MKTSALNAENNENAGVNPRRLAVAYRRATLNEFELDRYWQLKDQELSTLQVVVPRVHKVKKYLKLPRAVLPALFAIAIRFWWFLIFGPLILYKALALCGRIRRRRAPSGNFHDCQGEDLIFAGTSIINRSLERLPKSVKPPPRCLATSSAIAHSLEQSGYAVWLPEDVLELRDVLPILQLTWQIARSVAHSSNRYPGLQLQTYTCLDWIVVAVALSRLRPRTVWMTNLYDRWAVLVDFHCRGYEAKNLNNTSRWNRKTIVLQHGIEYADFPPMYKMREISAIWYFHRPSAYIYLDLSVRNPEKVAIYDFGCKLLLQKTDLFPDAYRVLLILHPMISKQMHSIVQEICKNPKLHIFAKPHPLHDQSDFAKYASDRFTLITSPNFFPEVDAVVSYRSALATEYEAVGTLIQYIEDDSEDEIVRKLISQAR